MCGIVGFVNAQNQPASSVILKKMTSAIAHRGPDGEGFYIDGPVALGHRRLAIIDLSPSGHQPMISKDSRYVLTYNGEIYNFNLIRLELERLGYQFFSKTDSEVVLNAFAEWGTKAISKFNGMFAFTIYDKKLNKLCLARDRYGIKPLYFAFVNDSFIFASEYKAILQYPGYAKKIDSAALLEYFTFQNLFTYKTLLDGIKMFPPGNFAEINLNEKFNINFTQYWDFDFSESETVASYEECKEELNRLFIQSVQRQLVTDVEIGVYLSGGMDSGSITAIAAKEYPYIKSFTCGFDLNSASGMELSFDERGKAEYMSYLYKTEHYEMVLKAGDMERVMKKIAYHIEDPRVGQSYPNYYMAQLASKFVKVSLSGAGGDEIFGGYPWRYYRAVVNDNFEDYIDKYYLFWQRLLPNSYLNKVFQPIQNQVADVWTRDIFKGVFGPSQINPKCPEDYVNRSLYFEAKTFLHGLLVVEDKLSMAHGLETRVPFLDNDLVDFAMKIPVKYKLNNLGNIIKINENEPGQKTSKYFEKTNDGKRILRDVMKRYIPDDITGAQKQGFSAPDASWFKGESINFVKKVLSNKNANVFNYFDYKTVQDVLNEHFEGRENRRLFIWSLLSFEYFIESYLE